MKNSFFRHFVLVLLLVPMLVSAQNDNQSNSDSLFIKQISDDILQNGKAYEWLHQLTKGIGGRLAGSPQFAKSIVWGKKTFESIGADKVYLQECMVPHWVRNGNNDRVMITAVNKKPTATTLDALALGNSLGTTDKGVTAEVFAVNDFNQLEANKEKLKGKIVFYNYYFNPTNILTFLSYGDAGKYRWNGASRAAKYGAVGVIIRSMSESTDNDPHTGGMEYNDSFPKIPAVTIGLRDADKLWNLAKSSSVKINMTTHGKMLPDTIGANVIAEIKGSEFPDEIISVGGHLDSWDINEGAHDDGAGVVHTMEVLRVLKALGYHPKRTIRFVLFANEETAGRGAEKYAAVAKEKKENFIFAFESDAGGFTPRGFSFTVPPAAWAKLNIWKSLFEPYGGSAFVVGSGGADNEPLQEALKTPVAEFNPDSQRYFDIHHARSDVFENVNRRELLLGAVNITALIYLIDKYGL